MSTPAGRMPNATDPADVADPARSLVHAPASPGRRRLLASLAALAATGGHVAPAAAQPALVTRAIPSSGEALPCIGLGSWITFNVGADVVARDGCADVIRAFFDANGRLIDSSPMYGSSQPVIGYGLRKLGMPSRLFAADKVWIGSGTRGPAQIDASRAHWSVGRFDLLQVHNLLAWNEHLPLLFEMKSAGRVRYVGITTSEGRRHGDIEHIMRTQPIDFVQVTYNPVDRDVESRILPLAKDRGVAVIANRPFRQGALIDALQRRPLPGWAADIGCATWAQAVLKFIVSHDAVTCAIPATTSVVHVRDNMHAARGPFPDAALRRRIAADIGNI
jgi:diketogulonate reductase-like aldo/keto reductase